MFNLALGTDVADFESEFSDLRSDASIAKLVTSDPSLIVPYDIFGETSYAEICTTTDTAITPHETTSDVSTQDTSKETPASNNNVKSQDDLRGGSNDVNNNNSKNSGEATFNK